ncbi:MAG: hypothetical protein WCH01_16950 [Methylococcaceae bacterium]
MSATSDLKALANAALLRNTCATPTQQKEKNYATNDPEKDPDLLHRFSTLLHENLVKKAAESIHEYAAFNAAIEWIELPEPKPDAIMVTCYTPSGVAIEIEASSPEHAEWLKRMNPKR